MQFDELNDVNENKIIRDEKFPIRMTLQFYKSTDNGVITEDIMNAIVEQLEMSKKQSDYVGSLVTQNDSNRPTDWTKQENKNEENNSKQDKANKKSKGPGKFRRKFGHKGESTTQEASKNGIFSRVFGSFAKKWNDFTNN